MNTMNIGTVNSFGWKWRDNGADVEITVNGRRYQVFVPFGRIHLTFKREFEKVGCPIDEPHVGHGHPVVGFFGAIAKAVKSVGRLGKRIVKKAVRGVKKVAKSTFRGVKALARGDFKGALRHGLRAGSGALDALDPTGLTKKAIQSPLVRKGLVMAAAAFPATAPFAPALAMANKAFSSYQRGLGAARAIRRGQKTRANMALVRKGMMARRGVSRLARMARQRDPRAMQVMGAFRQLGQQGPMAYAPPQFHRMAPPGFAMPQMPQFGGYAPPPPPRYPSPWGGGGGYGGYF